MKYKSEARGSTEDPGRNRRYMRLDGTAVQVAFRLSVRHDQLVTATYLEAAAEETRSWFQLSIPISSAGDLDTVKL